MNRLSFLKKLSIGAAVLAATPKIISEIKPPLETDIFMEDVSKYQKYFVGCDIIDESPSAIEVLRIRKLTGDLILYPNKNIRIWDVVEMPDQSKWMAKYLDEDENIICLPL